MESGWGRAMAVGGTQAVEGVHVQLGDTEAKGPYIWTQSVELRLRVGEGNKLQILGPSSTIRSFVWIKCALVLVTPS